MANYFRTNLETEGGLQVISKPFMIVKNGIHELSLILYHLYQDGPGGPVVSLEVLVEKSVHRP
jgi:hypothetical protein